MLHVVDSGLVAVLIVFPVIGFAQIAFTAGKRDLVVKLLGVV